MHGCQVVVHGGIRSSCSFGACRHFQLILTHSKGRSCEKQVATQDLLGVCVTFGLCACEISYLSAYMCRRVHMRVCMCVCMCVCARVCGCMKLYRAVGMRGSMSMQQKASSDRHLQSVCNGKTHVFCAKIVIFGVPRCKTAILLSLDENSFSS